LSPFSIRVFIKFRNKAEAKPLSSLPVLIPKIRESAEERVSRNSEAGVRPSALSIQPFFDNRQLTNSRIKFVKPNDSKQVIGTEKETKEEAARRLKRF
jgi:hypothetical protein